jgi:hypothetical protein
LPGIPPREHGGSRVLFWLPRVDPIINHVHQKCLAKPSLTTLHLRVSVPVGFHWYRHMLLTSSRWRSRCRPGGPHAQHVMSSSRRAIGPYSVLP